MARFQRTGRQREFRLDGSLDGEDVGDALSHGDVDGRQIDPNTAFLVCARHQPLRPVIVSIAIGSRLPAKSTRSEEHTSELQSLMRISYAVFCLKKKKNNT